MEQLKNCENTCASLEQQVIFIKFAICGCFVTSQFIESLFKVEDWKMKSSNSDATISKLRTIISECAKPTLLKLREVKQELVKDCVLLLTLQK